MAANSVIDFQLELGKLGKVLDMRVDEVIKKVAFDLEAGFKLKTPVKTGVCRAAWNTSVDVPNDSIPAAPAKGDVLPSPPPSSPNILEGVDVKSHMIYITNAVEYAQYLEGGSSQQAPAGMVLVTVEAIKTEIDLVIEEASKESL